MRWVQYFEARAYEAAGDLEGAAEGYEALLQGMGAGITRFPVLSDTPLRLESVRGTDDEANAPR
jgi:hypothetical protein